jgi:hypothetical protein
MSRRVVFNVVSDMRTLSTTWDTVKYLVSRPVKHASTNSHLLAIRKTPNGDEVSP